MNEESREQRNSIRIKDRVLLSYQPVSQREYEETIKDYMDGVEDPWVDTCHPAFQKDIKPHLKNIREKDKDLATVLEILDQKLNLVLGMIGSDDACEKSNVPNKLYKVDLSAKGIGLKNGKKFEKDTLLRLNIGLLPEHYFFTCFGKVVRMEKKKDGYFMGIKFIWITDDDEEKLIEHIFSRQVIYLRMRRKQMEEKRD